MSNYCVQCGQPIPEGQRTCSMCYGDPDHGRDGYYRKWLEDCELEAEATEIEKLHEAQLQEYQQRREDGENVP